MMFKRMCYLVLSTSLLISSVGFSVPNKNKKEPTSNQTKKVDKTTNQLLRFLSLIAAPAVIIGSAGSTVVWLGRTEFAKEKPVAAASIAMPIAYAAVTGAYGMFYGDNKNTLSEQIQLSLRWAAYGLARGLYLSGVLVAGMKSKGLDVYLNKINYQDVLTGTLIPTNGASDEQKQVAYAIRTLFLAMTTKSMADDYINPSLFGIKDDEEDSKESSDQPEKDSH